MFPGIQFAGPYRLRNIAEFNRALLEVCLRRALKGARRPGWTWFMELATELLKRRMAILAENDNVSESRRYLDSIVIRLPEMESVDITQVIEQKFLGSWFTRKDADDSATVLYFHGGGYSFYPKSYANFIAMITLAAKSRTFALDYSLAPKHRFPKQLEEALSAYRWLLDTGTDPDNLVVA